MTHNQAFLMMDLKQIILAAYPSRQYPVWNMSQLVSRPLCQRAKQCSVFVQTSKNKVEGLLWRCPSCRDKSNFSNISYIERKMETFEKKLNSPKHSNKDEKMFDDKIKTMEQRMKERLQTHI